MYAIINCVAAHNLRGWIVYVREDIRTDILRLNFPSLFNLHQDSLMQHQS